MKEKELLSHDNKKLGKIPSFSVPTRVCNQHYVRLVGCDKYCYAKRLERFRKAMNDKHEWNLAQSLEDTFVDKMCAELKWCGDVIRVHSFGDFYSQAYLEKWFTITSKFPHKTFYAYTKNLALDFSKRPANFRVLLSDDSQIFQNHWDSFDGVAIIEGLSPIGIGNTQQWFSCTGSCSTCSYCWSAGKPFVVFKKK